MQIIRHRQFRKNYQKRVLPDVSLDTKFIERFELFLRNSRDPQLKDHKLTGNLVGLRSFSVTGDIRVVYRQKNDTIELYDIGSHNQVY